MKDNSSSIIECIRSGKNNEALKYLYKDPLRKVRKFILNNSGTLDDANDVFQDAIIALFHYVKQGKYKEEYDLDGFIFKVAKNAWIDQVRKKQKVIRSSLVGFDVSDDSDFLKDMIQEEQLVTFHKLFNKLEENCKKILSYVVFEKKSMKEVSNLMGLKDDNVAKNQHYRCKKYFAKILSENQISLNVLRY
jgi:RNA polymerase sigma factor (sigma-70 family)